MFRVTQRCERAVRRWTALPAVLVLVLGLVLAGAVPAAAADPTASMSIQKAASDTKVIPGQNFTYTIQFQCTAGTVNGCVNAKVVDPMPSYLTITGPPTVTGTSHYTNGSSSTQVVLTFTDDLGNGQVGLAPGKVITVQVPVHVADDAPPTADGTTLHNTATITADNATTKSSSADVTLNVPRTLGATTTKAISPSGGPNTQGSETTATVTGSNTSNVPVDQLVITDPVLNSDGTPPAAPINPFTYLEINRLVGNITWPQGADTVRVRAYDSATGTWVDGPIVVNPGNPTLPPSVPPSDITGVQLIFTSTSDPAIPPGATGGVSVVLDLKKQIPDDQLPLTITNAADTTVTDAQGESTTSPPASATYRVPPSEIDVTAGKKFDPNTVHVGDPSTVTLTGTNGPDEPLDSMTITEPAPTTPNHLADGTLVFTQMGKAGGSSTDPATSGIVWPANATTATITYSCAGTPASPQTTTIENTLPAPPAGCDPVTGFTVTFAGDTAGALVPGAQATIPFVVTTTTDQPLDDWIRTNTVLVSGDRDGNTGSDTALAVIRTIKDRIRVEVGKKLYPSTIPSYPGEIVTAELSGRLLPFPDSTVDATTIVVQDPSAFPDPHHWYDSFDPQAVTATPVPACSTLTVQYTANGTTWTAVPGMESIHGATIYNGVIPDAVGTAAIGVRFVYTADPAGGGCSGGFPPGTSVSPNLSYAVDGDGPAHNTTGTFTNCTVSSATSRTTPPAESDEACANLDTTTPDAGSIQPIGKAWDQASVVERSQSRAGVTLSWSTAGYTGTQRIDITDTQDPGITPIAGSVFDTFDLVRIDPITPSLDPWLTYDQITRVQLYELPAGSTDPAAGAWVDAPGDPCPSACDGTFPGYTLTAAQRSITIGFRLTYIESPTRVDRLAPPGTPAVGSGVAASTGNDRHIHPVFQLRDVRRSDATKPVVHQDVYNTPPEPGVVDNTVRLDPYWNVDDTTPILTRTANDTILITNVDVTVDGTKTWTGGPLGIPQAGVPQSDYPTSRVTVTASNTTPSKIDRLVITDPDTSNEGGSSCLTSPFDTFNLSGFTTITPAGDIGATGVTVHLTPGPGGKTDYTPGEALALTEAQLGDVTGMTVTYTGRINYGDPAPTATVTYDVRLRTANRTTSAAPEPGSVCNQVHVQAADMVDFPGYTDAADAYRRADIALQAQGIGVTAGKSFDPTTITEPSHGPATVTLSGQPSGPSRTVKMVLEDSASNSAATFFNAYDFDTLAPVTWVGPVNQVTVDAYVGGTWSVVSGKPVLTGGHWELGTTPTVAPDTTLHLPAAVTDPTQVQGVRFAFTRTDGANWENPADPKQTVSFAVLRRDTLHTGGPVPSDLKESTPAPGETVAGDTTDTTTAVVTSSDRDGNGNPLTAQNDASATIHYAHATNAVQIRKTPNGETESPGTAFPYAIPVKNVGDVDITNPVITDVFPTDAGGPQVVLAPDAGYTFTITGGTGMPTDPADVTIVETATGLMFTFPQGSTLPIGATYTISFSVVTRPGLPANSQFTNSVGVTGDRPWDQCDNGSTNTVETDGSCRTEATNTVISAGAISVTKKVKAQGSDVLGVAIDPLAKSKLTCLADAAGFYSRPCVPIAQPGGDITWRMHFVNSGNLPLDRVLGIDRLPAPGDTLATAPDLKRLSDWQPLLTGVRPTLANAQPGILTVYYTTESGWCDSPQASGNGLLCDGSDATGNLHWQVWPAGQTLSQLGIPAAGVTGLQVVFTPDVDLAPAGSFDVDVAMIAPASSPADTPNTTAMSDTDSYAFNTVGTSGRIALDSLTNPLRTTAAGAFLPAAAPQITPIRIKPGDYTLTTEPPRVGVGLAHGGLRLLKSLAGDATGQYAPDSFPVTLSCTSVGETVPLPADVAKQTLSAGTPVTVYDLPYHATCTLTETDSGQTSSNSPVTATVQREIQDFETADLVNTFDYASLAITKNVNSAAVDQDGKPIPYGPFTVTVTCTYLNHRVYADGYGPLHPMAAELPAGDTVTFTELPAGASCVITETDDKGAAATTIETTVGGTSDTTKGTSTTIELAPDADGHTDNTAVVTNSFAVGSVSVVKKVTGEVAAVYGSGPFVLKMTCVLDDDTGTRTVWAGSITLGGGAPLSATVVNIAAGAECTIVESDAGGASSVTVDPTGPISVDANETATITVTNRFDPAKIYVDKKVDGDAAAFAPHSFPIQVTCSANSHVLPGFPVTVQVTPGAPAEIDTLVGAQCSAVELNTGQATDVSYDPAAAHPDTVGSGPVVANDHASAITVTNTYRAGGLQIIKNLTGPGAAIATGPFVFDVQCAFNGNASAFQRTVTLPRTGSGDTLKSDPIAPLPVGAVCTVTETGNGGADSSPAPVTVTIKDVTSAGALQTVTATLVDPFSAGSLRITKKLAGEGASAHTQDVFGVDVQCQVEVAGARVTVYSGQVEVVGGQTATVQDASGRPVLLPIGTHCWAAEPANGGADSTSVDFNSYDNAAVVGRGGELQVLTITVTNAFSTPAVLPNTGAPISAQLWWGTALLAAGLLLLGLAGPRRRRGRA